jgi:hypothetical protein
MAAATRKAWGASTGGQSVVPGGGREDRLHRSGVTGTAETNFRIFRNFRRRSAHQGPQSPAWHTLSPAASSRAAQVVVDFPQFPLVIRPSGTSLGGVAQALPRRHRAAPAGVSAVSASDRDVGTLSRGDGAGSPPQNRAAPPFERPSPPPLHPLPAGFPQFPLVVAMSGRVTPKKSPSVSLMAPSRQ